MARVSVGVVLGLACVIAAPCAATADIIELTNGQRVVGIVTDAAITGVVVEVNGREMRIAREDVQSIVFETLRPAPVAADAPVVPTPPTPALSAPPPPTPVTPPLPAAEASSPPPAVVPPTPPRTPMTAALAALDRLQAATVTRLAPGDYTARVEDARRDIAPALGDASSRTEVLDAIGAAIRYHAFAARAGAVFEAQGDLAAIGRDAVVTECRPLTELIRREAERARLDPKNPAVAGLITVAGGAPALRTCAGEQIAEAERQARASR